MDLEHSVDPAYRNERFAWMLNDLTLAFARKLKDGDDRPIWGQGNLVDGIPATLNGRRYIVNNDMPTLAADSVVVVGGDFRAGYIVRRVREVQAIRLDELYARRLQVGFLSWMRADGVVQDTNAVKSLVTAAA